jgi:hypothetical protein
VLSAIDSATPLTGFVRTSMVRAALAGRSVSCGAAMRPNSLPSTSSESAAERVWVVPCSAATTRTGTARSVWVVLASAASVSVEVPGMATDDALNVAVTPVGRPLALSDTVPVAPVEVSTDTPSAVVPPPRVTAPTDGAVTRKAPQEESWKEAIAVLQLPVAGMYSAVYQKVQSSRGSIDMLL